jgi:hypothetical protein
MYTCTAIFVTAASLPCDDNILGSVSNEILAAAWTVVHIGDFKIGTVFFVRRKLILVYSQ